MIKSWTRTSQKFSCQLTTTWLVDKECNKDSHIGDVQIQFLTSTSKFSGKFHICSSFWLVYFNYVWKNVYNSSYHTVVLQYYLHLWMSCIAVSSSLFLTILKIFQMNRMKIQTEEDSAFILEAADQLKPLLTTTKSFLTISHFSHQQYICQLCCWLSNIKHNWESDTFKALSVNIL